MEARALHSRLRLQKLVGRYLLMEIFLYVEIEDLCEQLHSLSIQGRQYLIEMFPILKRRSDEECEERDLKKDRVQVDLRKLADWDYIMMNCNKYKRPINYEVKEWSFDDAVSFMSKVAENEDQRSLIKITSLRVELDLRGRKVEKANIERFQKLVQQLGVRHL
jgi:pterin-4a-carbinolamine dehydratase